MFCNLKANVDLNSPPLFSQCPAVDAGFLAPLLSGQPKKISLSFLFYILSFCVRFHLGKRFCRFKKKCEKDQSHQYYWQLVLLHFPITGDKKENTTNHKWRTLRLKERKKYADPGTDARRRVDGWVHAGWLGRASLGGGANIVGSPSLELLRLSPYFLPWWELFIFSGMQNQQIHDDSFHNVCGWCHVYMTLFTKPFPSLRNYRNTNPALSSSTMLTNILPHMHSYWYFCLWWT